MPASGFHFTHVGLNRGEVNGTFFGSRTASETPGPGSYEPYAFLNNPVKRHIGAAYFPDTNRQENAEPFSLSRARSQQLLVDYPAADFWDHHHQGSAPCNDLRIKRADSLPRTFYCRSRGKPQTHTALGWRGERKVDFRMMQTPDARFSPLSDMNAADHEAEIKSVHRLEECLDDEPREGLVSRVKSQMATKLVKEKKHFIHQYQTTDVPSQEEEFQLHKLIATTGKQSAELQSRSMQLQVEAEEANRILKAVKAKTIMRLTDKQMMNMSGFERMQQRTREEKAEEDLQRDREEAQINYSGLLKKLNHTLIELQDFRIIYRELQRLKIEKLTDALRHVGEGRLVRSCIRGLIQQGADKIQMRLDSVPVKLDQWMKEVLINSSYLELQIEECEARLVAMRENTLNPAKESLTALLKQTKEQRVEALRMLHHRSSHEEALVRKQKEIEDGIRKHMPMSWDNALEDTTGYGEFTEDNDKTQFAAHDHTEVTTSRISEEGLHGIQAIEKEIKAHRQLLNDIKWNVAAVVSNQIVRAKGKSKEKGRAAVREGMKVLACLTSEEFAKLAMKDMQKTEEKEVEQFTKMRTVRLNGVQLSEFRNLASSFQQIASAHSAMQSRQSLVVRRPSTVG